MRIFNRIVEINYTPVCFSIPQTFEIYFHKKNQDLKMTVK